MLRSSHGPRWELGRIAADKLETLSRVSGYSASDAPRAVSICRAHGCRTYARKCRSVTLLRHVEFGQHS